MAFDEATTYEQGLELQRKRDFDADTLRTRNAQRMSAYEAGLNRRMNAGRTNLAERPKKEKIRTPYGSINQDSAIGWVMSAEMSREANKMYKNIWDRAQDLLEQFSLMFFGVVSVVTGPFVIIINFIRQPFIRRQFEQFRYNGIAVDRVPGYDTVGYVKHTFMFMIITVLTVIFWVAILTVLFIVTNPQAAGRIGLCIIGNFVAHWFGQGAVCTS